MIEAEREHQIAIPAWASRTVDWADWDRPVVRRLGQDAL